MKRVILIVLVSALSFVVKAQSSLDDFYKQGTWWCEYEWWNTGFGAWGMYSFNFRIGTDTTINSTVYHKLLLGDKILGGLRTSGEKVFFIRTDAFPGSISVHSYAVNSLTINQDTILYDFNMAVGDTVKWGAQNQNILSRIDSIQLSNGQYIKRYVFGDSYWMRGPGSSHGLFGAHVKFFGYGSYPPAGLARLKYYESGNASITINIPANEHPSSANCFSTDVNNIVKKDEVLCLYPNPLINEDLNLKTTVTVNSIIIRDMTDRVVYKNETKLNAGQYSLAILLRPGVYSVIVCLADGSIENRRVIKEQ
jgi:hypothetical protein